MLRHRALGAATLVLAAMLSCAAPARADQSPGTNCSGSGAGSAMGAYWGNNSWCNGSTYQYPFYVMGNVAAAAQQSCTSYTAGAVRWNTTLSNLEVCDGTTWQVVGVGTSSCGSVSGLSFTNVTNATLNTVYTSGAATITFSGCSGALSVSVSGSGSPQISVNGGAWSTSGAIQSGQTLQVRLTSSGSVSTGLTATVTVASSSTNWTVTTRSGSLKIFLTANAYIGGTIGGLSGADAICQAEANPAGYSGTWKAVMSDDTTSAASRLTLSYPIVNAYDGSTVAATNLWVGSITTGIKNPSGGTSCSGCSFNNSTVWTGTDATGAIETGYTCSSWGSNSSNGVDGFADGTTNAQWIAWGTPQCNVANGLYCIQQ